MNRPATRSAGFTLIEILVGMALGLMLVSGVMMFFASNKQHFRTQQEVMRMQENQRFAAQFLTRDIHAAGYRGCAGGRDGPLINSLKSQNTLINDLHEGIEGFDDVTASLPSRLDAAFAASTRTPKPGTDVLVLRAPEGDSISLSAENSSSQVFMTVTSQEAGACHDGSDRISGLCVGDFLLISDCQKARLFQAGAIVDNGDGTGSISHPDNTTLGPGNSPSTWGGTNAPPNERFDTDSDIARYGAFIYFIADGASGESALYRKSNTSAAEELVEGVEDMQILYGINTNGDENGIPELFGTATTVGTNWDRVVAVRIELLLRGTENNVVEGDLGDLGFTYNGQTYDPPDKRRYKTVSVTASLRNRLP